MIHAKPLPKASRPPKDHNIKAKAAPVVADRLRSYVDRIERVIEEVKERQGLIKDIYSEVKGVGYDVSTLRKVIRLRGMNAADRAEQEALLHTYMHALGMVDRIDARLEAGESQREIAAAEKVSKSTVQRRGPKTTRENDSSKMDRPPATGEIKEDGSLSGRDAPSDEHSEAGHETSEVTGSADGDGRDAGEAGREQHGEPGPGAGDSEAPARVVGEAGPEVPKAPELQNLPAVEPTKSLYQRITGSFADIPREPRQPTITDAQASAAVDEEYTRLQSLRRAKGFAL